MRPTHRILLIVLVIAAAGAALNVLGGGDTVEKSYSNLAEAKADRLFERGWLPEVLPPSARDIHTANNLDTNTSAGRFSFEASDYPAFASRTQPVSSAIGANVKRSKGFTAREFSESGSKWLFYCKPESGYCEYELQTQSG